MADLVIRGMRIPPQCVLYDEYRVIYYKCPFADEGKWDVLVCTCPNQKRGARIVNDYTETRHPDCPLVPLPAGHGRLCDLDALCAGLVSNHPAVIYAKNAPTILPAEGGTDDG